MPILNCTDIITFGKHEGMSIEQIWTGHEPSPSLSAGMINELFQHDFLTDLVSNFIRGEVKNDEFPFSVEAYSHERWEKDIKPSVIWSHENDALLAKVWGDPSENEENKKEPLDLEKAKAENRFYDCPLEKLTGLDPTSIDIEIKDHEIKFINRTERSDADLDFILESYMRLFDYHTYRYPEWNYKKDTSLKYPESYIYALQLGDPKYVEWLLSNANNRAWEPECLVKLNSTAFITLKALEFKRVELLRYSFKPIYEASKYTLSKESLEANLQKYNGLR